MMVDEPAQLRQRAERAGGQAGALAEALRAQFGGDPLRLARAARVVPGDGRMQHAILPVEQHAGLGHAGHADAPHAALGSGGDRRARGLHGCAEQRLGVDLGAGRHLPPRGRRLAVGELAPVLVHDRRLAGGRADVDADEQVRQAPAPFAAARRPAGDQHDLAADAARPGGVRQEHRVTPAQLERLAVLGLERPVALEHDEDREAGLDLGLRSGRDALGAEERVGLVGQQPGDRPVGPRTAQRARRRAPSGRRTRARSSQPRPRLASRGSSMPKPSPLEQHREVARLLQLDDQQPLADRVGNAGRHEERVPRPHRDGVERAEKGGAVLLLAPSARASRAAPPRGSRRARSRRGAVAPTTIQASVFP